MRLIHDSLLESARISYGALSDLEQKRVADVFVSAGTRVAVSSRLTLDQASCLEVTRATLPYRESLTAEMSGEVSDAVGGGSAVDAVKYAASKTGAPLACIPTAMSVDAFFTWASGHREDGCVRHVATRPPEEVVIDLDVIASGPPGIRVAGITDVLSIATGRHDWKLAHEAGRNPKSMAHDPHRPRCAERTGGGAVVCRRRRSGRDRGLAVSRRVPCTVSTTLQHDRAFQTRRRQRALFRVGCGTSAGKGSTSR